MHPLYLGGEDAPHNLGAVEFNRHRRGHPRLDNQTVMFESNAIWIASRVCSPFLVDHPIGQEYEVDFSF